MLDKKLVTVTVDASATSVTVAATQQTGSDTLHLADANGATADIAIRVAFNAGTIVPQATLKVTGNPAQPDWLVRQVKALVTRLTQALPNAQTQIGAAPAPIAPLAPGSQMQFSIPVQITSPTGEYFDQNGTTVVTVANVGLDPFDPMQLFYDDDPEHVVQDGVLFRAQIAAGQPSRLYYYHDDGTDPRRVVVVLTSLTQNPTSVQAIDVSAGPNIDVMQVGHAVSREFLLTKSRSEGTILDLPQDAPYFVADLAMNARQGVAGTMDLRVLSGGPVKVTVLAVSPDVDPRTLLDAPVLADDGHHRTGAFRLAGFGTDSVSYNVGGEDAKVVIGDREPTPPNVQPTDDPSAGHDYGDYGVTHTIDVALANPTDAPATAYLYFRPIAGIARASFLVDGNLVEIGCVRQPVPYQIASYDLPAHQNQRAFVQTMTDGGSFYPVEIGVTTTPPQPAAPPITAPDGCFPRPATQAPSPSPSPSPPGP